MNQRETIFTAPGRDLRFLFVLLTAVIASLFLLTSTGFCESTSVDIVLDETVDGSVELTPGYISGTVDLGGQNINRIDLSAASEDYLARIYQTAEGPYSMTVNVPGGSGLDYAVSGMVWMDSWTTALYFKDRAVFVEDGLTSPLDIIIDPGYIAVEIVTNGCTLAKSEVDAFLDNGDSFSRSDTRRGSENTFRLPVQPNSNIDVYGQAQLTNGKTVSLASKIVDVYPGMDTHVSWELNCGPGMLGAIQHDVNYHMPIDYNYTYLYDEGAWTYSRLANHQGSYLFDNLAPGNWRLYTYSYWNNRNNFIAKDLRDISVAGGETVYASIDEYPGFLQGRVTLTGTHTMQDAYSAYVYAYGRNGLYPSYRSYSRARVDNIEGNYNLALPHGEWSRYVSSFFFSNIDSGDDYLYSQLHMYDYAQYYDTFFINSNETITGHDISYETGSATIKYSRSDGGVFTSPYLYAKNYQYNESNRLDSYVYVYAMGTADSDKVTFVGFPGTYEVDAWATVDGSMTTFGKVAVEIEAGVDKVVDIGGPELTVISPDPGSIFMENLVVVSGTVTDDMGVAMVTVNDIEVQLFSTDNLVDPNEVFFSIELELLEGENLIDTVAFDTSGNQSSDNRTVIYEVPEPDDIEPVIDINEAPESDDIEAVIDIKPGSCKNPLNVKSKGVLPVAILGSSSFSVSDIDPSSIQLVDVDALRSSVEDAATSSCSAEGPDGYPDLTLKFDTQEIVAAIGDVNDGDVITLTLTGALYDGTELSGDDIVTVLVKGKKK
jgi:hypothetical protein